MYDIIVIIKYFLNCKNYFKEREKWVIDNKMNKKLEDIEIQELKFLSIS